MPTVNNDLGTEAVGRIPLRTMDDGHEKTVNHTAFRNRLLKKGNALATLGITQLAIATWSEPIRGPIRHCHGICHSELTRLGVLRFWKGQAVQGIPDSVPSPSNSGGLNLKAA